MPFTKLSEVLRNALIEHKIPELTEFQLKTMAGFKAGKDFIGIGPEGCGKTHALVFGILERLQKPSEDDAPRAVIAVSSKEKALELEALFLKFSKRMDLRIVMVHDKGHKVYQRIDLYEGADVVIGTSKRLYEMYLQNGLNIGKLKIFAIDDSELIFKQDYRREINRITESITKCQYIFTDTLYSKRMKENEELFMTFPNTFEVKEKEKTEDEGEI